MSRSRRLGVLLLGLAPFLLAAAWQPVAPMPEPRWFHGAALGGDGKIYVMGGWVDIPHPSYAPQMREPQQDKGIGRFSLVIYDPKTNTWSRGLAVPKYKSRARSVDSQGITHESTGEWEMAHEQIVSAADTPGRVYWLGGVRGGPGPLRFDPRTGAWEQPSVPIYQQSIERLDPVTRRVVTLQRGAFFGSRAAYSRMAAAVATGPDGKIYIVGGVGHPVGETDHKKQFHLLGSLEVYDPATDTWTEKAPMQQPRQLHAAAFGLDGKLYVFGGTEIARSVTKEPDESWELYEARVAEMRRQAATALSSVEAYNPRTNTWEYRQSMPVGKENLAAARGIDGRIYLIGGTLSYSNPVPQKTVEIYDPVTDTWTTGPQLRTIRQGLAAVATPDGKIYAIGGTSQYTVFHPRMLLGGSPGVRGGPEASVEVLDTRPGK